jgi:phosphoenolpyruvate synthase/pyruvate phosphate dikinase
MEFVLQWNDPAATQVTESGGKGANLARLTQAGFAVPHGFVIRGRAYRQFTAGCVSLAACIAALPANDSGALRLRSRELRDELAALALPATLQEEVRKALSAYPDKQAFSVRSSSTLEDLALAAFAGQHETYLNVRGSERILECIKACYLSLWSERAIAYRQQQKFDHVQAAMAVVVQTMVQCDAAGVAFSINPVSGNLQQVLINANYGLGESVVSGEGQIDQFSVEKSTGQVIETRIGAKTHKIVSTSDGTKEVALSPEESGVSCLTDTQIAAVAKLARQTENHYQFPQDIEWGFADSHLFLLQSRPITAIPPRWTRDESAERFPFPITPLTWDFVDDAFHQSLRFSLRLMGFPPFNGKWFGMHGNYIYGNQNAVDLYLKRVPLKLESIAQVEALLPRVAETFRWVQELPVLWSRDLDDYLIRIGEFLSQSLEREDLRGVWRYVHEVQELGAAYFQPNIAISITQALLHRALLHLLVLTVGKEDAPRLHDGLLAFCETKTGIINRELYDLARIVQAKPELAHLFASHVSRSLYEKKLLAAYPEFARAFEKFLRDHGHREVEFDAYQPTWVEVPWVVLDHVRLILQAATAQAPLEKERELRRRMQQAELELFRRIPQNLQFFFHEMIRLARTYTSLDDLEHYQTTRLTLPFRKGARELGRRLYVRGVVREPMDVFFAHVADLDEAVAADHDELWRSLTGKILEEKQAYVRAREQAPEWVLGVAPAEPVTGRTLTGLPGSPGEAEGPVFLVRGMEDFVLFPKGAVLVARTTNPTWTPLFYSARAVITESGGPLSHGAVTAREMQIPAVMSVRNCMSVLKNDERVRVDGSNGRVHLL